MSEISRDIDQRLIDNPALAGAILVGPHEACEGSFADFLKTDFAKSPMGTFVVDSVFSEYKAAVEQGKSDEDAVNDTINKLFSSPQENKVQEVATADSKKK